MTSRIIRIPEVRHRTGLFPRPLKLAKRAVGWPEEVIDQWIEDRKQKAAA
jgi:predicted DNA-binding transcriptional regulator AlpA